MNISYNWLKQFINTTHTPQEISTILTDIGLEVESIERVQTIPGGLEGLVVGYVKDCIQHPNADRLRITTLDVGTGEDIQVVCGAPNVATGQKVIVATVGTTVYPLTGEPFKINKSKIRGEASEGMICAEDEIGLGISHDGIMVLDSSAVVGTPASTFFNVSDDFLYEIGLTPNRADAVSHLGVARDLAAYLRIPVTKPDVSNFKTDEEGLAIQVEVLDLEACPRYSGLTISGVTVKDSPDWLKDKLKVIGIRPINNVVDATNYVLHELGQPLHAFDADKISGGKVIVKKVAEGTSFTTLDEVERKLSAHDLMICNADEPMCIAGVFGGIGSGVKDSTKNIFLESAYFNAVSVRKTAKRFGLKTDASFRYERGTDPEITVYALKRAALLIKEVAGGAVSSPVTDIYPNPIAKFHVDITYKHVDRLIGQAIPHDDIKRIITGLGIEIKKETAEGLSLDVPTYKVDVTRECDVIEEILRIYGYNNIAIPSKVNASLSYAEKPDKEVVQHAVADMLTSNGFSEIMSNSLTKSSYSSNLDEAVKILNPLSIDLDVMRQTLMYSGLEAIAYNQNRKNADLKIYEFGKTYHLIGEKYDERPRLMIMMSGAKQTEQWNHSKQAVSFYGLKAVVDSLLSRLAITTFQVDETSNPVFAYGLKYFRGDRSLVEFGVLNKKELKKLGVDKEVLYADIDWTMLLNSVKKNKIQYQEVTKFPAVRRDLSMLLDKAVTFGKLKTIAHKTEKKLLKEVNVFDVYEGDKLPAGKKSYALSFVLQDEEKTLTDKQTDAIMQKLITNFEQEVGAEVRK